MPQLKQLSCCVQWSDTGAPFQEHGTVYGDGVVETFIIVPNKPQGFSIRLTSRGFIHEGLVVIVFIDGNYQCNRTRVNLRPPKVDDSINRSEVDFLLRQKEKSHGDGLYLGREWRFDNHNIVAEPPSGFQESHFDDLGTIEVLVLRCRAKSREEADYEGSSSGEDSDVFGVRPGIDEEEIITEHTHSASNTDTVSAPANPQPQADPDPPTEEDSGMGLFGLFDGANDEPDVPEYDGGHDAPSGRWIWHQSHTPFVGFPDPPQYHQPEGHRFRTQSHIQPPMYPVPQSHTDRRNSSVQAGKRVHFDDWRPGQPPHGANPPGQPSVFYPHLPQRPPSRTRERYPAPNLPHRPMQPHGPQIRSLTQHETRESQPQRRGSISQYHDEPRPKWGYGNGTAEQNSRNGGPTATPVNNNETEPQKELRQNDTLSSEEHRPSPQPRRGSYDPATASQPSLPQHAGHQQSSSRQSSWNDSREGPSRKSSWNQDHLHPSARPFPTTKQANETPYYSKRAHEHMNPNVAIYPPPVPVHYHYPYVTSVPQAYHHPFPFHPGYWPTRYQIPYGANGPFTRENRRASVTLHPPHQHHPGMEEPVSPTNVAFPTPDQTHQTHQSYTEYTPNQQGDNGEGRLSVNNDNVDMQQAWNNDNNGGSWENQGNGADQDQGWDQDANGGNAANNSWDQNDTAGDQNNDANATSNDQNNDDWGNADDNNANTDNNNWSQNNDNNDGWGNQGNDTSGDKNNGDWGAPEADKGNSGEENTSTNERVEDVIRDLYGPHGPYYALQATRAGQPPPDSEEEPRFDVPKLLAAQRRSTKQVQPGPGYRYYKKRVVPDYVDTLDNPYARFVFKYRTKDQLSNEIGIEVDVEPTGDSEIQDLQNLDKQALIEMLMRAKGALGGKVPSPPPTPSTSTRGSENGTPFIIDAPKHSYLKYSLPPLRPNNMNTTKMTVHNGSKPAEPDSGKQNKTDWDTNGNNTSWDKDANKSNENKYNWDGGADAAANGKQQWDATSSQSRRPSQNNAMASQQGTGSGSIVKDTGTNIPPRPLTPPGVPPQQSNVDSNWDAAGEQSGNSGGQVINGGW